MYLNIYTEIFSRAILKIQRDMDNQFDFYQTLICYQMIGFDLILNDDHSKTPNLMELVQLSRHLT